jgi:hypothetical protein
LKAEPSNELRAVLGNKLAIAAYRARARPFPDGTILVKLAWKNAQSPGIKTAHGPGQPSTVQLMVKDSIKYAATGGWGFGRFVNGTPADEAQHQPCFPCYEAGARARDFVFTRFAT